MFRSVLNHTLRPTTLLGAAAFSLLMLAGTRELCGQTLVTDAPTMQPGGTAFVGQYTADHVVSAGPTFHFTAPVVMNNVSYDPGPGGVQELGVRTMNGCVLNQTTAAGTVCDIETTINSRYAGARYGRLRVTTNAGVFTVPVEFQSLGAQVVVTPGILSTIGGDVAASSLTSDALGNIYFTNADLTVRKIDATTGVVSIVAGALGSPAITGDGAAAIAAHLGYPVDVTASPAGDLYVVSSLPQSNDSVRKINGATGTISTVSSFITGRVSTPGNTSGQGTDGAVVVDDQGNIYTSVTKNETLTVTAGDGSSTKYLIGVDSVSGAGCNGGDVYAPTTLAVSGGYLYFQSSGRIYKMSTDTSACHVPVLVAGTGTSGNGGDGGLATQASFGFISGIAVDAAGDVYIADASNSAIRVVSAATGTISTVAGFGTALSSVTVAPGWASLALDVRGNLYVISSFGSVQKIDVSTSSMSFAQTQVGDMSSDGAKSVIFSNIGNDTLASVASVPQLSSQNFVLDSNETTCGTGNATALAPGASCVASANFAPTVAGADQGLLKLGGLGVSLNGTSIAQSTPVVPATYTITVNPNQLTLQPGQSGTASFVFAPTGGFAGSVSFSCSGLPAGASCSFAKSTLTADGSNKQQTSVLTVTTSAPTSAIAQNTVSGRGMALASLAGLNGMLLMWLKLRRKGALSLKLMGVMLLLSMGVAGATGCGAGGSPITPAPAAASTTVNVVATSMSDHSSQTAAFTLTIQ